MKIKKISFDLFDEEKQLLDQNVCLQVKEFEEEVLKVGWQPWLKKRMMRRWWMEINSSW